MKLDEAKLALLDGNVIRDLATRDTSRQAITQERLDALHAEGLLTAVASSALVELAARLGNPKRFAALIDTVIARVDVYLPFDAGELLRIEVAEADPSAAIGSKTLQSTRGLVAFPAVVNDQEAIGFFRAGGFQSARLKTILPRLDPDIRKLTVDDVPSTFAEFVRDAELDKHVAAFLENASDKPGEFAMSPDAFKSLFARGKAIRIAILMVLANHYRRAKEWVDKGAKTKDAGALSDTRIIAEGAYCHVLLTADKEFVACGQLVNEVVAEPTIRRWMVA